MKKCCGNCKFNEYGDKDFFCSNEESDVYGCETSYNESCECFEAEEVEDD